MPTYTCLVRDGETTTSTSVLAASLPQAVQELRTRGLHVFSVQMQPANPVRHRRRSEFCLTVFLRQLASALRAGLPLPDSLRLIAQEAPVPRIQSAARQLYQGLTNGESLAASASLHRELFDDTTVALLEAGERSGALDDSLESMSRLYCGHGTQNELVCRRRV